ncbi:C45 family peptidase [Pseudonocardia sp. DSM 110487]|uniref:C45 family autoproteolytic acyltransferase/hydolase n=1 Tax=Pseudonocardia sp. DSM 110487 TaxID=2865833 RepID=UPI00210505BF|nr:C45 family peptidase [Pseudonocardia sp. DSM 110487]
MTIPTHTSTEIDPHARGSEFGARWPAEVAATFHGYAELFDAHGATAARVRSYAEEALRSTEKWAPALAAEMAGIAEGAGLAAWQVGAVNARTEILAALDAVGEGECSTAVVLPGGGAPRTVQTWDWHPHLREVPVLWAYEPCAGRVVRTFTEFGVLAKIGVSTAGLGVHFNILRHASDSAEIGVPVHLVARRILDEAATVDEAVDLARTARTSASTAITVVTADAAATLELCPDGVAVVPADGVLLHTNHFLDPDLAIGERLAVERPLTYDRLTHLRDHVDGLAAVDVTARAEALVSHGPHQAPVCAHPDPSAALHERWETVATISLDVAAGSVLVHEGGPCGVIADTWQTFP